jgi:hypothetical protein
MKKIRLDPESLEVVSFTTAGHPEGRGTVRGADTGNPCYVTIGYQDTMCLAYEESYWGEETCRCGPVEATMETCETAPIYITC